MAIALPEVSASEMARLVASCLTDVAAPPDAALRDPRFQTSLRESVRSAAGPMWAEVEHAIRSRLDRPPWSVVVRGLPADESGRIVVALSAVLGQALEPFRAPWSRVIRHVEATASSEPALDEQPHTDSTDWLEPNGWTVLQCIRPDRRGGGRSRIIEHTSIVTQILEQRGDQALELVRTTPMPWAIHEALGGGTHHEPVLGARIRWMPHTIHRAFERDRVRLHPSAAKVLEIVMDAVREAEAREAHLGVGDDVDPRQLAHPPRSHPGGRGRPAPASGEGRASARPADRRRIDLARATLSTQATTHTPYALPHRVGAYGTRADFEASRNESGQWVFWRDRVDLVLEGRYHEVMPLHVELSPTYLCNFSCPWCSCRSAREVWSDENVFAHPQATDRTVMSTERLTRVVEHLGAHRVGIQWVGGEPTMHPALLPAARRAKELGIKQCLFTNGSVLGERRIESLFESELVFVRVSLDAVTKDIHQLHHGYSDRRPYAGIVLGNLDALVRMRHQSAAATMVGVSIVVDDCNLQDVVPTVRHVATLCDRYGHGAVDFVIIRPTFQFYNSRSRLRGSTITDLRKLVGAASEVDELLQSRGVSLVTPAASFDLDGGDASLTDLGESCLSCGWFGEITPTGDVVVCSDRYGNPDYMIGSAEHQDLGELWSGGRRTAVLDYAQQVHCFKKRCPRNGRGFQLNKIFHQIERFRDAGRLDDVRIWIDDLRAQLPEPGHSFFL